ncbi:MAG: hypothetical protein WAT91_15630 [Saprospiraceae bacterium]
MNKAILIFCTLFAGLLMFTSCGKESEGGSTGGGEAKLSTNGSSESHNMGQNCMNCHQKGGEGEGWFTVAGTIYNQLNNSPSANGLVELYTGPNGTGKVAYTIQVDARGNFYTTENINFGNGLYPASVVGQTRRYMPDAVTSGQCNSCHGSSTHLIYTN